MKSSIPVNCPWGSACSCCVTPVHFRPPVGSPVLSLHVHAPLPVPRSSPAKGPACNEVDLLIQVNCHGAQHTPVVRPPFTFGRILRPGFEFSPRARAGPRAAAVEDEGFGLSACWSCSACCHTPFKSSPRSPWPPLSAHVPGPPQVFMLPTQAVRMKSLQAAERPADLAPIRFNC
jgi:hypothetical protein